MTVYQASPSGLHQPRRILADISALHPELNWHRSGMWGVTIITMLFDPRWA